VYEKMNMGGLLGTASHGTGDGMTETMSDHLVGFRMLTPDGNVVEIHKNDRLGERERELLRAVRCSMGALGIVFEVTLRVTPCYPVREHDFFIPVQEGLAKLDEIVDANMFVELFWVPFADNLWIKSYNRANPPGRFRPSSIWYWLRDGFMYWFQLLVYPGLLARRASMSEQWRTRTMLRWLTTLLAVMMGSRIVRANQAFHFQRTLPKVIALEIAVRREDFVDVCRYMMARIRDREVRDAYPTNIMLEARFISRSQETHGLETAAELRDRFVPSILLSPAVFDETAYIELVGYAQTEGMLEFFREVERGVMAHWDEARPHWGKYFTLGAHLGSAPGTRTLAERYNENRRRSHWRMARFLRVREQLDPNHVMSNAFLEREVFLGGTRIPPSGDHLAHYLEDVRPCFAPPEGPHA
jgi:L-gulonolactone oxidase